MVTRRTAPPRRPPLSVAAAVPAAAATTAGAAAPALLGPGFVDRQGAAVHFLAVEGGDGRLRLLVARHLDEPEALGPAAVPVHDDLGRLHGAVGLEHLCQVGVAH